MLHPIQLWPIKWFTKEQIYCTTLFYACMLTLMSNVVISMLYNINVDGEHPTLCENDVYDAHQLLAT